LIISGALTVLRAIGHFAHLAKRAPHLTNLPRKWLRIGLRVDVPVACGLGIRALFTDYRHLCCMFT